MQHITLSQLQSKIKFTLEDNFSECWVAAEINEINVNNSGHCYIMFVEKGGDNQVPRAKISGVIWRSQYTMLNSFFREATGQPLHSGIKVLVKVSVNYHELYGISLVVKDIDPTYTLGDMERQRQECINKLKEDGIFEMNK
ncbi:MAG: exodeoxyribonuclease VII large subunit, partial [Rikenellaceae bacterium]